MARIGETKCCNAACTCADVAVHKTSGGKLSVKCHKCGMEQWAPLGTRAHRDLMAQITLDEDDGQDLPESAPATAPAPAAPVKQRARGAFAFDQL